MSVTEGTPLNPLVTILAINDDTRFTAGEARAMVRAVRHTDNATRRIRMSQAGIAGAVDVSRDTVKRAFRKAYENGYFAGKRERRNDQGHRVTDYWFKSLPPLGATEGMGLGAGEGMGSQAKVQAKVQEKAPSTPSTPLPTSTAAKVQEKAWHDSPSPHPDADKAPSFWDDETSTEAAPEKELIPVDRCVDHGNVYAKGGCPHCSNIASRERSETKHSEERRIQWFNQNIEQNEDPKALGNFDEEEGKQVGRYQGRSRH